MDIEANFMSFIYSDLEDGNVSDDRTAVKQVESLGVTEENKFRNSNLEKIESAKLSKGLESLGSATEEVGFDDLSTYFNLEKVGG